MARTPNTYSPEEVRRAIMSMHTTDDNQDMTIAANASAISAVSVRVLSLETNVDFTYTSETDATVVAGQPVYLKANTHVDLACSNASLTQKVAGVAITSVASGQAVKYNTDGKLTKTDWTSVTGATLLTPGADYYLSDATPGMLTMVAPTTVGSYVEKVGKAISTVIFDIEISCSILL